MMRYDPFPFFSSGNIIGSSISFLGIILSHVNLILSFMLVLVGISFFFLVHITIKKIVSFDKNRIDRKLSVEISSLRKRTSKPPFRHAKTRRRLPPR